MALSAMILVIIIIFILFSYFICCYGGSEGKIKNRRYKTNHQRTSLQNNVVMPPYPTVYRNPSPTNIGFNLPSEGSISTVPPVGIAPSGPSQFLTLYPPQNAAPYPPVQAPYPLSESLHFPKPQQMPSAPVAESLEPPSYYEATKQSDQYKY